MARRILCSRCGKIHEYGLCENSRERITPTKNARFRSSGAWTKKAKWIKERDNFLCQACLHDIGGEGVRYTSENLEVHHIEKLENEFDKRLDDDNLITLCGYHHEKAEAGLIPAQRLKEIAETNENIYGENIPPGC